MTSTSSRPTERNAGDAGRSGVAAGFTLLEVLAAVALLAVVYTVLAGGAIQGLRAEGEAARRLRASFLADARLAEIEANLVLGQVPALGSEEAEEDEFVIHTEVSPLDLSVPKPASATPATREEQASGASSPSLLVAVSAGTPPPLRRIEVRVVWSEAAEEHTLSRVTYALDWTAAAPLLSLLGSEGPTGGPTRPRSPPPAGPAPERNPETGHFPPPPPGAAP